MAVTFEVSDGLLAIADDLERVVESSLLKGHPHQQQIILAVID